MIVFTVLALLTAYPALSWRVAAPSFGRMLEVGLWLSVLCASYNGAMVVALTEIMPVSVLTSGFSLAYSLATAIFGGFTPVMSTWPIKLTGANAAPGYWVAFAAACGLAATLFLYRRRGSARLAAAQQA